MPAQQKASKGSVGIESFQGRLRLRLPRQLYGGKQKYLTLGVADTPENQKLAASKARQIELDILAGYFDFTLEKYKLQTSSNSIEPLRSGKTEVSLDALWDKYIEYKSRTLSVTTINKDYKRIKNHITGLPTQKLTDAVLIRDFLLSKSSANTAKRVLTQFKACCDWAIDSSLVTKNPFDGMAQTIKILTSDEEDSINPFTRDEQEKIVAAFAKHRYYRHYTSYVRFLFMTGCRTSEAIGLTWEHIDEKLTRITFREAVVEGNRKDTKTHKIRRFPINESLKGLLLSIKPNDCKANSSVFQSPRGGIIDAHNFLNRAWKTVLSETDILYRPQYNTRHTFITNCLEAGISVVQVAKWVGNSPEIIMKHYAGIIKQIEVPDF